MKNLVFLLMCLAAPVWANTFIFQGDGGKALTAEQWAPIEEVLSKTKVFEGDVAPTSRLVKVICADIFRQTQVMTDLPATVRTQSACQSNLVALNKFGATVNKAELREKVFAGGLQLSGTTSEKSTASAKLTVTASPAVPVVAPVQTATVTPATSTPVSSAPQVAQAPVVAPPEPILTDEVMRALGLVRDQSESSSKKLEKQMANLREQVRQVGRTTDTVRSLKDDLDNVKRHQQAQGQALADVVALAEDKATKAVEKGLRESTDRLSKVEGTFFVRNWGYALVASTVVTLGSALALALVLLVRGRQRTEKRMVLEAFNGRDVMFGTLASDVAKIDTRVTDLNEKAEEQGEKLDDLVAHQPSLMLDNRPYYEGGAELVNQTCAALVEGESHCVTVNDHGKLAMVMIRKSQSSLFILSGVKGRREDSPVTNPARAIALASGSERLEFQPERGVEFVEQKSTLKAVG